MLHALTTETKTDTASGKAPKTSQPERVLSNTPGLSAGLQRRQSLMGMQSTHGNQAVLQMMSSPVQVARTPAIRPSQSVMLQRCACGGSLESGGECAECKARREAAEAQLQSRSANPPVSPATGNGIPSIVHEVLRSPGQPLDVGTRAFMEPRFGHDFSHVRVHTDVRAAESARAVNALAYTVGGNVVFGTGQYAPGTSEGRRLMAHELTHVVQQEGNIVQRRVLFRALDDEENFTADQDSDTLPMAASPEQDMLDTGGNPDQGPLDTTSQLNDIIMQIEQGYAQAQQLLSTGQASDQDQQQLDTIAARLTRLQEIAAGDDDGMKLTALNLFSPTQLEQAQAQLEAGSQNRNDAQQLPENLMTLSRQVSHPKDAAEIEAEQVAEAFTFGDVLPLRGILPVSIINRQGAVVAPAPPLVVPAPPPPVVVPAPPAAPPWWIEALESLGGALLLILAFGALLESDTPQRKCPPCPPNPPPEIDRVPPSAPHFPCPGDHWHYQVYNQNPTTCQCFLSSRQFGGCCGQPSMPNVPVPAPC